jgi:hypothetical protein
MGCSIIRINIDGERHEVEEIQEFSGKNAAEIKVRGAYYLLVDDFDTAEEIAKDRYREMDARELICMVGEEQIVDMWTRGKTLEDWLEDLDVAQELAGWDGEERDVKRVGRLQDDLGWVPTLAYRTN